MKKAKKRFLSSVRRRRSGDVVDGKDAPAAQCTKHKNGRRGVRGGADQHAVVVGNVAKEPQKHGVSINSAHSTMEIFGAEAAAVAMDDFPALPAAVVGEAGGPSMELGSASERRERDAPPPEPPSRPPGEVVRSQQQRRDDRDSSPPHSDNDGRRAEEHAPCCPFERTRRTHRRVSNERERTVSRRTSLDVRPLRRGSGSDVAKSYEDLVRSERFRDWASSLRRLDPRYQILTYFDDVARDGGVVAGDGPDDDGDGGAVRGRSSAVGGRGRRSSGGLENWTALAKRLSIDSFDGLGTMGGAIELSDGNGAAAEEGCQLASSGRSSSAGSLASSTSGASGAAGESDASAGRRRRLSLDMIALRRQRRRRRSSATSSGGGASATSTANRRGSLDSTLSGRRLPSLPSRRLKKRELQEQQSAVLNPQLQSPLLRLFNRAGVFTVWRPCSSDAIRAMMTGAATGKGLDVKGKSAKQGLLSGYVPFVQIHSEFDKDRVGRVSEGARMRVFYGSVDARDAVRDHLQEYDMQCGQQRQQLREASDVELLVPCASAGTIESLDAYGESKGCWGLECPQRLFWEALVLQRSIYRETGSGLETGRPSEPAFQDMNLATVRLQKEEADTNDSSQRTAVVWQRPLLDEHGAEIGDPLDPRTLLVAYEERGRVLPVVSDFDAFIVGTRGVTYDKPLPDEQVDLVKWCVEQCEGILDSQQRERPGRRRRMAMRTTGAAYAADRQMAEPNLSWTAQWLAVLKRAATTSPSDGGGPNVSSVPLPEYGFGDPTSYSIMGHGIERLECGAVRHGAECFNYKFPQEIDDHFLVVSDTLPGPVPWRYVSEGELRELLARKVDEGFAFPLNPKWVLCDPGWKGVYDQLMGSANENIRRSMDVWFPSASGVRERIEEVCARHPGGYAAGRGGSEQEDRCCGTEAMDLAELQLRRYLVLQRVKRKLRAVLLIRRLGMSGEGAVSSGGDNDATRGNGNDDGDDDGDDDDGSVEASSRD